MNVIKGLQNKYVTWSKHPEKYTVEQIFAQINSDLDWLQDECGGENAVLPDVRSSLPNIKNIHYYKENEGTAKVFRDLKTDRWYHELEIEILFGKNAVRIMKGNVS